MISASWEPACEFSATPNPLVGIRNPLAPNGRPILLAIDALSLRDTSKPTTKSVAEHLSSSAQYFLDTREESNAQLARGDSLVRDRDYLEPLTGRGSAVQASA